MQTKILAWHIYYKFFSLKGWAQENASTAQHLAKYSVTKRCLTSNSLIFFFKKNRQGVFMNNNGNNGDLSSYEVVLCCCIHWMSVRVQSLMGDFLVAGSFVARFKWMDTQTPNQGQVYTAAFVGVGTDRLIFSSPACWGCNISENARPDSNVVEIAVLIKVCRSGWVEIPTHTYHEIA